MPAAFCFDGDVPCGRKTRHTSRMDICEAAQILPELGNSVVAVMQPAEARMGEDRTGIAASDSCMRNPQMTFIGEWLACR